MTVDQTEAIFSISSPKYNFQIMTSHQLLVTLIRAMAVFFIAQGLGSIGVVLSTVYSFISGKGSLLTGLAMIFGSMFLTLIFGLALWNLAEPIARLGNKTSDRGSTSAEYDTNNLQRSLLATLGIWLFCVYFSDFVSHVANFYLISSKITSHSSLQSSDFMLVDIKTAILSALLKCLFGLFVVFGSKNISAFLLSLRGMNNNKYSE